MTNIMIIEDDEDIRDVLECVLEDEGFSSSSFEELDHAFFALDSGAEKPDLILLDFMFPSGNSAGFLTSIRDKFAEIPVILMSAGDDQLVGGNSERASGFISKPIQIESLLKEIGRLTPPLAG